MRSKAAIANHPIHPALIALPIGGFVLSIVADLAYLISDREMMWYDIAFWAAVFGVVTALVAAIPGAVDYMAVARHTDARTTGMVHGLLNITIVALFAVSILLRTNDGAVSADAFTLPFILSLVGVVLLSVSGWLGGELVFKHHIAVQPDTSEDESDEESYHDRVA
jgi:uncharacterized membrane protein